MEKFDCNIMVPSSRLLFVVVCSVHL